MIESHVILILLWTIFSVLHSLFAADKWKRKMQQLLQTNYKYYRIWYSFFALLSMAVVIVYNFTMHSFLLWKLHVMEQIIAVAGMLVFGFTMLLFTRRFFFDLSGADVFQKKQISRTLIKTDLYKYVRHPLYSATLGFVWSIFFYYPSLGNFISCLCITAYTIVGIFLEEQKLITEFGENYINYRSKTPMLVPKIFSAK